MGEQRTFFEVWDPPEQKMLFSAEERLSPEDPVATRQASTRKDARHVMETGMEDVAGAMPEEHIEQEQSVSMQERAAHFLERIADMDSFEIARELLQLGPGRKETKEIEQLRNLMAGEYTRTGFAILLNLIGRKKIRYRNEDKEVVEKRRGIALNAQKRMIPPHYIPPLELAQIIEELRVPLQPRRGKYGKMNGVIRKFRKAIEEFHSSMAGARDFWKDVVTLIADSEARDLREAQRLFGERSTKQMMGSLDQ